MKRAIVAIALVGSMLGLAACGQRAPSVHFDSMVHDFGHATEGDMIAASFTFRNTGNAELKLQPPDPTCGCTVASVKPDTLPPGATGEITFELDLTNARGPVEKYINLPSNDPLQPTVKLSIKGEVTAVFKFSSELVMFGEVTPGRVVSENVRVERLDGKPLQITSVQSNKKFISTKIEPDATSNGRAADIIIEIAASGKPEQFSDVLSVFMDNADKPASLIAVVGSIPSSIKVEPEIISWEISDPKHWPGQTPEATTMRTLIISSRRPDRMLDLGDFGSTLEDLMVKVVELEKGKKFEIAVKLSQAPTNSTRETLSFDTNFPDYPTIEVPVMINVSQPGS